MKKERTCPTSQASNEPALNIPLEQRFDDVEKLTRTLAHRISSRFSLKPVTKAEVFDDLTQEAWCNLLEYHQQPDLENKQILSRVMWRLDDFVRCQVFQWDKNYKQDRPNLVRWEVVPEYQFTDENDHNTFNTVIETARVDEAENEHQASIEAILAGRDVERESADAACHQFFQKWSGSDFILHRIKLGEQLDPHHPDLEHALYLVQCAEQLNRRPHQKLFPDIKRDRAYILMRRIQGEDNRSIAEELDSDRQRVGIHVISARKSVDRWLKLDLLEQHDALRFLHKHRPAIEAVSLTSCRRNNEIIHPQDTKRLDRLADVILRKVRYSFGFDREEWGYHYPDLKQVALLHLITQSAEERTAAYAYGAALREVRAFIFFQIWQKDPRFNRKRDKHLALDVELIPLTEFESQNSRRMPEPLLIDSPEDYLLYQEWQMEQNKHWQHAKQEICDILLAMADGKNQRIRKSIPIQAECMIQRLRYGYSAREIGDELEIPIGTVSSHLRRVRQQVQQFQLLSTGDQAARLLYALIDQEELNDIPAYQLQHLTRPLHICVDGKPFTLCRSQFKGRDEVYLKATYTIPTASGGARSPSVYIGRPSNVTHDRIYQAVEKLKAKLET